MNVVQGMNRSEGIRQSFMQPKAANLGKISNEWNQSQKDSDPAKREVCSRLQLCVAGA